VVRKAEVQLKALLDEELDYSKEEVLLMVALLWEK
jgi:hypothetical protein